MFCERNGDRDDSWPHYHAAFAADAAACRDLIEAAGRATEAAADAYRARARARAPDGWVPADEEGYFVRLSPQVPAPSIGDLVGELRAFYAARGLAHHRVAMAARGSVDDEIRARVRRWCSEIDRPSALSGLMESMQEPVPPVLLDELWVRLEELARLLALGAPEIIVDHHVERAEECVAQLRRVQAGEADAVAAARTPSCSRRRRSRPTKESGASRCSRRASRSASDRAARHSGSRAASRRCRSRCRGARLR